LVREETRVRREVSRVCWSGLGPLVVAKLEGEEEEGEEGWRREDWERRTKESAGLPGTEMGVRGVLWAEEVCDNETVEVEGGRADGGFRREEAER
jgi:hypothetical protein